MPKTSTPMTRPGRGSSGGGAAIDGASKRPPGTSHPFRWLGAPASFGLALPDARPSESTLYAPRGVWLDDQRLIVCDSGNHRILIWHSPPASDHAAADVVLGQPDFASEGPAAGGRGPENGLHLPTGVIVADERLVVADAWHHRLLVWNEIPRRSDQPPDYAIGQRSLSCTGANRGGSAGPDTLYWPYGVAWIAGRLIVTDTGNRRVLIWEGLPDANRPADGVLGQPTAYDRDENRGQGVSADSFRWPHDVASDGKQFFVADAGNHRVLVWDEVPEADCRADYVLGQPDFHSAEEWPYRKQDDSRLRFPYAADVCASILAVADTANNRILFWRLPVARACGAPAFGLIGQATFADCGENRWQSVRADTLCWPYGISFNNGWLAVADSGNNRVMIWDCRSLLEAAGRGTSNLQEGEGERPCA